MRVDTQFVQPSVIKCIIPPRSEPGIVSLFLLHDGQKIDFNTMNEFEYRESQVQIDRKKKIKNPLNNMNSNMKDVDLNSSDKEFKLRIIERLDNMQQMLYNDNDNRLEDSNETMISQLLQKMSLEKVEVNTKILSTIEKEVMHKNV